MAINPLFNWFRNEQEQQLYEDVFGDFCKTFGIDVIYLPRQSNTTFDLLFGDDPTKYFSMFFTIECFVQNTEQFGAGELYSKFGLQVVKQASFLMPRKAFQREVGEMGTGPGEGDLLWLTNFKALFEIKYVDEEYFFYPFGKHTTPYPTGDVQGFYGWNLMCEKFRFNDEVIATGVTEIDTTVNYLKFAYDFTMSNANSYGSFVYNEVAFQTANSNPGGNVTASANVAGWDLPSGTLTLTGVSGAFSNGSPIFGSMSGAEWTLTSYDMNVSINDKLNNIDLIQSEANTVLNVSESNPFAPDE
ncbi:MAG: hypothetical protein ACRDFB_00835 [Rhabdochlamydiaceae bacterium]